VEEEEI